MNQDSQILERAKRQAMPMPESRKRLSFKREFSQEEYTRLSLGLVPREMEDKWLIFLEDNQLFFHRSWTGHCLYQLCLEKKEQGYSVAEAWGNRNQDQYRNTDDEYDGALLAFLIDNFLLGKHTPFPVPSGLPEKIPQGLYQHHVAGTAYPEKTMPIKTSFIEKLKQFFRKH